MRPWRRRRSSVDFGRATSKTFSPENVSMKIFKKCPNFTCCLTDKYFSRFFLEGNDPVFYAYAWDANAVRRHNSGRSCLDQRNFNLAVGFFHSVIRAPQLNRRTASGATEGAKPSQVPGAFTPAASSDVCRHPLYAALIGRFVPVRRSRTH